MAPKQQIVSCLCFRQAVFFLTDSGWTHSAAVSPKFSCLLKNDEDRNPLAALLVGH